jgi:hypothetical protein
VITLMTLKSTMAHVEESTHDKYTPEYMAADHSRKLINVAVTFAVLETFFFVLFLAARFKSKTLRCLDVYFMVLAYPFCFSLTVMALRRSHLVLESPDSSADYDDTNAIQSTCNILR